MLTRFKIKAMYEYILIELVLTAKYDCPCFLNVPNMCMDWVLKIWVK